CKNIEEMESYYVNIMGLSLVQTDENKTRYLSTGLDHHNVTLTPSNQSSLMRIGFQISSECDLKKENKRLKNLGIISEIKTNSRPGISELLELKDPDGFIIQLYTNIEMPAPHFKEKGIAPNKLGHIALGSVNPAKSVSFYNKILNFKITDKIGERANFITCNSDHPVINVCNLGKLIGMPVVYHIAFEFRDASHQYKSLDILQKNNIKVLWGPTRHTAGHNIAAYHHDPDGNVVELFIEMDQVLPNGIFEPRPWHEELPMKSKQWTDNAAWGTSYAQTIFDYALQKYKN